MTTTIPLYNITWKQSYPGWSKFVDNYAESLLKCSEFRDALKLIAKIKSTL